MLTGQLLFGRSMAQHGGLLGFVYAQGMVLRQSGGKGSPRASTTKRAAQGQPMPLRTSKTIGMLAVSVPCAA